MNILLKIKNCVFLSIFAFSIISCVTEPSINQMKAEIQSYKLPIKPKDSSKSSLVYVVRPSSVGFLVRFNVFLDNKEETSEIGWNRGSNYLYFFVEPGKHTIFSKAENWAKINIEPKEKEIIFIRQNANMGIIMARNSLEMIDEVKGSYYIKNSTLGTIINFPKEK